MFGLLFLSLCFLGLRGFLTSWVSLPGVTSRFFAVGMFPLRGSVQGFGVAFNPLFHIARRLEEQAILHRRPDAFEA